MSEIANLQKKEYFSPEVTGRCQPSQEDHSSVEQALQHIEEQHAKYMNSVTRDLKDVRSGFKQFPEGSVDFG